MLLVVLQGRTAFLFSFFFPARVLYLFKIREVERLEYKNRRHCVNTLGLITRGQYSRGARSTAGARLVVKPLQEYDPPPPLFSKILCQRPIVGRGKLVHLPHCSQSSTGSASRATAVQNETWSKHKHKKLCSICVRELV